MRQYTNYVNRNFFKIAPEMQEKKRNFELNLEDVAAWPVSC